MEEHAITDALKKTEELLRLKNYSPATQKSYLSSLRIFLSTYLHMRSHYQAYNFSFTAS